MKMLRAVALLLGTAHVVACSSGQTSSTPPLVHQDSGPADGDAEAVESSLPDASPDAADAAGGCDAAAPVNDPQCPSAYPGVAAECGACSTIGLQCSYPGKGDSTPQGCPSGAILWCVAADAGTVQACPADSGASGGRWVVAQ